MTEYLELNATDCKHCYKCIRNCPVKAISFSKNQANIVAPECILCGRCFVACPQSAKTIRSDVHKAKAFLQGGAPVVASIAPSFVANYPGVGIEGLRKALVALGFAGADETALGATIVKRRYDEMVEEGAQGVIISSCCHTVNMLIQKHCPEALPYVAAVLSPMQAHCAAIKQQTPGAKTVFIGPCISKKAEAEEYPGTVDCVLTFEELDAWFAEENLLPQAQEKREAGGRARLFPTTGGILRSMKKSNPAYSYMTVDGVENCILALKDVAAGKLQNCFVEMSACSGSCIAGPAMGREAGIVRGFAAVDAYAAEKDFEVTQPAGEKLCKTIAFNAPSRCRFGEKAITDVLHKIGKTKPEDELNCGCCGYDTCRQKAQAVLEGKADLTMCLPYLMGKAQSFSDTIIEHTPNGIVVLSETLEVQQINAAACALLNVKDGADVLGRNVVCVMDPGEFLRVMEDGKNLYDKRVYLAEYDRYVKLSVILDKEYGLMIGFMRDITDNEAARAAKREVSEKTIQVTDKVIEKHMRIVQEIASLLGETAAETQIALTKLKETLSDE